VGMLLAVLITLGVMSRHNELLALQSGGVSLTALLRPVLVVGVLVGGALFALANLVVPAAMARANVIWLQQVRQERAEVVRHKNIWVRSPEAIVHVRYVDRTVGSANGVSIFRLSPEFDLVGRIEARAAIYADHGRWHLRDAYLCFYLRFVAPNRRALALELVDTVWANIDAQMDAFVGRTAYKELCREWVLIHARSGYLPFAPEDVGSHWVPGAQVDVVAISWRDKEILLGECEWRAERVGRAPVRALIKETPQVLAALPDRGVGWTVHYALFGRAGFDEAAEAEAERQKVQLVDLKRLDQDLQTANAQRGNTLKGEM